MIQSTGWSSGHGPPAGGRVACILRPFDNKIGVSMLRWSLSMSRWQSRKFFSKSRKPQNSASPRSHQSGNLIAIWVHPRCHEREAEASTPWHRGFWAHLMGQLDWQTARTHRAATRRVGDQAITSPGRCALNLSLRAQVDANDPDLRHEADRYIRPGQFPCSEVGVCTSFQ